MNMTLTKASGVVGASSILVAGGSYGVSILFSGVMPDYEPLSNSDGKYVSDFKDYFVDASKNDSWWKWSYKNRYLVYEDKQDYDGEQRVDPKTLFVGLTGGLGKTDKHIQNVCLKVYEAENAKVKKGVSANDEYEEADIWRYCTGVKYKPKTIAENMGEDSSYKGSDASKKSYGEEYKDQLVSITVDDNVYFWKEQTRLFFKKSGGRSGSKFKNDKNSIFGKLWHRGKGDIKEECLAAYKLPKDNTEQNSLVLEDDLFKFCSLKGQK